MSTTFSRRQFLKTTAVAAAGAAFAGCQTGGHRKFSANEKLNIGFIGTSGQAEFSIGNLKNQNIVALCDVDATRLAGAAARFPSAKTYRDFRRLIDQKDIDAIVVATPDHTHAVATAAALRSGRDVYCEKPLTHTVSEARIITELARKHKAVTQMGNQIHAGTNYRRIVELVQYGFLGAVREVHVWVTSSYGGKERPTEAHLKPATLDWDLWLGPAAERPYHPDYAPFKWRDWWAFGGGSLADFGCHFMDLPFWALDLKYPTSVEPLGGPPVHTESTPPWLTVRYNFPARGTNEFGYDQPAVNLTWYHGGRYPTELITPELFAKWKSGVLFVGEKGTLLCNYSAHAMIPESKSRGFARPAPFIPNSIGHHNEWVEAIKTRGKTTCHFGYAGPLTEAALLGNVAYRVQKKIDWDGAKLSAKNCPEAEALIQHHYRPGWVL